MSTPNFTRRSFIGALTAATISCGGGRGQWTELFNGRSLEGWTPVENPGTWSVRDGALVSDGDRSHLFYTGPVNAADFKNFELEVEVSAAHLCNSGVYFHTKPQESGWPEQGFEVQINNTATGSGNYRERKKTGSLYGVRNIYKQLVADDEWFTMNIAVRGKNVQTRVNGTLLVDYTEFDPPITAEGSDPGRVLGRGTFALQGHDPGSRVRFRSIRVRPLPDDEPTPGPPPRAADKIDQAILDLAHRNVPVVDYHVHLKEGLDIEQALENSRRVGIQYGIAVNCGQGFPVDTDDQVVAFYERVKNQPVFLAMQAEGREWTGIFSAKAVSLFDYVFTDSMTWTGNRGKRMRLWIANEVGEIPNPQEFMDTLVDRTVGILNHEPIDIYVNPTFLPAVLEAGYDSLWTEARMDRVAEAAAANHVAVEINNRYKLPSLAFLGKFKEAGCKFSWGTNNGGPDDLKRCEYAIEMTRELGLGWQDFFVPGAWRPKAVERKGSALKG